MTLDDELVPEGPITPEEDIVLEQAPGALDGILKLEEFEAPARRALTPGGWAYIAGGAADELVLRANVEAFRRRRLRPRVLVDVSTVDPSTTLLGTKLSMPVVLAPTALNRLAHPDGEVAAARAAAEHNVLFCMSTLSSCSLEEVAEAGSPRWFQLYLMKDRSVSADLLQRAEGAGYSAVVFTVDLPVVGYREAEMRVQHDIDFGDLGNFPRADASGDWTASVNREFEQALTWRDIEWIRNVTSLPVVVKGILTAEDTALAVEHGADAIVVSNHGGRQLDRAPAAIDVLEECVSAARERAEVYVDGGVRRGVDVVAALALGARGVLIGRPYLFALAHAGQAGVSHALRLLAAEFENALALVGAPNVGAVTRAHTF